jgi:hypothetical protein
VVFSGRDLYLLWFPTTTTGQVHARAFYEVEYTYLTHAYEKVSIFNVNVYTCIAGIRSIDEPDY